jgi:hypothetical protein
MIDFPCMCGHKLSVHTHELGYCLETYNFECNCSKYMSDNLRYLESLVDNNG